MLSPLGEGVDAHREGWLSGRSAVGPVTLVEPGPLPFFCAGEVSNCKARNCVENRKNLKVMTRPVRLGVAAAHLAMADAGLVEGPVDDVEPTRFGMFVGAPHAWGEALFFPPFERQQLVGFAPAMERIGRKFWPIFAGVVIIEAVKQLHRGIPVASAAKERRVAKPVLVPAGAGAGARVWRR